jgi:peptide/nickel transport system ATP-binding protein
MSEPPILSVKGMSVETAAGEPIIEDLDFEVRRGEVLGLVGESGSGKTTTGLALLCYARRGARIRSGEVRVEDKNLAEGGERDTRRKRGRVISYVPQDPAAALNPAVRIGRAIEDMLRVHGAGQAEDARVGEALKQVQLPPSRQFRRRFPHQLSGGQQQRVAIATALVCAPKVAVLDEPTTGLDVVTQARLLNEIDRVRASAGLALVYVSHDLAVVARIADRIAVMYAGRIVEQGPTDEILHRPRHPYTRGLVASVPDPSAPRELRGIPGVAVGVGERPQGCAFAPRCDQRVAACEVRVPDLETAAPDHQVRCLRWRDTPGLVRDSVRDAVSQVIEAELLLAVDSLTAEHRSRGSTVIAAANVSFDISRGECVALVGESGSGKTTIARCVVGLHVPSAGRIMLAGVELPGRAKDRSREDRRRVQIIFQNPNESLNPRQSVEDAIALAARDLRAMSLREAKGEVEALLDRVRLPSRLARRYPSELSGGERQRVAIARALVAKPDLIVCDEITSALDVSVQAAVLELLNELRRDLGLALLFISHDLGVVASVADRALVLEKGVVREEGLVSTVLSHPSEVYTKELVAAAPRIT